MWIYNRFEAKIHIIFHHRTIIVSASAQFGKLLGTRQIPLGIRWWVSESNMADLAKKKERTRLNGYLVTLMAMQSSGF